MAARALHPWLRVQPCHRGMSCSGAINDSRANGPVSRSWSFICQDHLTGSLQAQQLPRIEHVAA